MKKVRIFLIAQGTLCVALALLLIIGAVGIYCEGSARKAADPLAQVYTAEEAGNRLGQILPAILTAAALMIAGIILGLKDPNTGKPAKADGPVTPRKEPEHIRLIRAAVVVAAAVFILLGILNGSARDVLVKGIHICSECIGLG